MKNTLDKLVKDRRFQNIKDNELNILSTNLEKITKWETFKSLREKAVGNYCIIKRKQLSVYKLIALIKLD